MQFIIRHYVRTQTGIRKPACYQKAKQLNNNLVISTGRTPQMFSYPSQAIKILLISKYYMIVSSFEGMSFKLSSSMGQSAIQLEQEKDSIMSFYFACSSNGNFPGVVQISFLCSVCFLGRWIRGEMGWGRRCRLRERMKRRFITPQPLIHENTKSTSATELGLIISSSPSQGGSEGL